MIGHGGIEMRERVVVIGVRDEAGSLAWAQGFWQAHSTPESLLRVHYYNGRLARALKNELDGVRSRIVEGELNYG